MDRYILSPLAKRRRRIVRLIEDAIYGGLFAGGFIGLMALAGWLSCGFADWFWRMFGVS